MRPTSFALENFSTGQIANWNFSFEGLEASEQDGAAGFTPAYDSALPPLILKACLHQDGVKLDINDFAFTVENTLGFLTSTCDENGRIASRITDREVSGSFNPYKDDTSVDQWNKFDLNTTYELVVWAYNPSSVSGEIELGSAIVMYFPNCITTEKPVGDQDGLLTDNISFRASTGADGTSDELTISFI